ncbi:MAG: YihY/virulence factor BrkB family protein [Nitriliruptor sp.]|uniref:YihY/virulence factor BrkB family protein n=1 Tax=Nitriliruptor sp. TaxID=2448056 RepID=UPI00349FD233
MHPLSRRIIDRSPERIRPGVTLLVRTAHGAIADRLPGLAAELAFWVLLSLPALLLTAIAALSLVAGEGGGWRDDLIDRITEVASVALSTQAVEEVLRPVLDQLVSDTTVSVVSIAFLTTLWTASRAIKVVLVTIAITYGREEPTGFGHRVLGLALTVVGLLISLVAAPLLILGPGFGERLATIPGVDGDLLATVWRVGYWPAVLVLVTAALASLYHVGAPWDTRWLRDVPGAVLATVLWLAGSSGLRLYGTWILDSDSPYGPLAGPLVGLLWIWLTGFAVLIGAELNAQIEQLWPTRGEDGGVGTPTSRLRRAVSTVTTSSP